MVFEFDLPPGRRSRLWECGQPRAAGRPFGESGGVVQVLWATREAVRACVTRSRVVHRTSFPRARSAVDRRPTLSFWAGRREGARGWSAWVLVAVCREICPRGLRSRPHSRSCRPAARPAPRPPGSQPPETVVRPGDTIRKHPEGDPRRLPPESQQRPRRSVQQGEATRPPRVRIPLRQRRSRAP